MAGLNVGADGGIEQGFGGSGKGSMGAKNGGVEGVVAIRGNEREDERLSIGELVVAEETREEGEERGGGAGDGGGCVGLKPLEEGEEGSGARSEGFGGEDREEEGQIAGEEGNVGVEMMEWGFVGGQDSGNGLNQLGMVMGMGFRPRRRTHVPSISHSDSLL